MQIKTKLVLSNRRLPVLALSLVALGLAGLFISSCVGLPTGAPPSTADPTTTPLPDGPAPWPTPDRLDPTVIATGQCCSPFKVVMWLSAVTITPEPVVDRVVTLHIELTASEAVPDATVRVELPDEIALVEGSLTWQMALVPDQPQARDLLVKVLRPTDTGLLVHLYAPSRPGFSSFDAERLLIHSTLDSATVITASEAARTPIARITLTPLTP